MSKSSHRKSKEAKQKSLSTHPFTDAQMEVFSTLLLDEKASALQAVADALTKAAKAVEAAAERVRRSV